MAEESKNFGISKTEISALREALFAQQDLLQKLYSELDVEREAAASAASEALAMILRLQGEKAAIKMEANQYKRLAEEKMCHSEESLAIFEDLIYHKELEIASLEYQVQAYKYKLLSLGCPDIGVCETKFPENLLQINEILESKNFIGKNAPSGDLSLYWEEIKILDERVREISNCKGHESKSKSLPIEHPQISPEIEKDSNPTSSSNVYDVFEVPIVHESEKSYEKGKFVSQMVSKSDGKDESKSVRKLFSTKKGEKFFSGNNRTSEIVEGPGGNYRERGDEEFKLLKEIKEKLDFIQCEIKSMKNGKCSPANELSLLSLSEAMLHFWL